MEIQLKHFKNKELDINQLALVLAQSVWGDPFSRYFFPSDKKRSYQLPYLMRSFVNYAARYGEVLVLETPDGQYCGGALWLSSANPTVNPLSLIKTMFKPAVRKIFRHLGLRGLYRVLYYGDFIEKEHLKQPGRHYYLMTLGIVPEWQNRGLGIKLMESMLAKAKEEGVPCYLETQNPQNHNFYFKHGFRIVAHCSPKGCPPFWGMSNAD